jgi:hypothetical protein
MEDVNARIDKCITDSSVYERILWGVLSLMFLAGLSILTYGVIKSDRMLMSVSLGETGVTTWPIARLIQLHRRRIALASIPTITSLLSPRDAAREIHLLVQHLLDKK